MSENTVEIASKKFNMDEYPYICLSKTITMVSPNKPIYFLVFVHDDRHVFSNENNVNVRLNDLPNKDEIYKKIETYLLKNPSKHIRFDGCCFHYP